jgi:hypothetical protein
VTDERLLTTDQAAALLAERGITVISRSGRKAPDQDTVTAWCRAQRFAGAIRIGGRRRGVWLIPRAAVETFEPPPMGRPPDPTPSKMARAQRQSRKRRRFAPSEHH